MLLAWEQPYFLLRCSAMMKHTFELQVLLVSRLTVLIFGLFSGVFCIGLVHAGIDISW